MSGSGVNFVHLCGDNSESNANWSIESKLITGVTTKSSSMDLVFNIDGMKSEFIANQADLIIGVRNVMVIDVTDAYMLDTSDEDVKKYLDSKPYFSENESIVIRKI